MAQTTRPASFGPVLVAATQTILPFSQHTSSPSLLLLSCGCVVVVVAAWLSWLYAEADSEHVMNKFKLHY